jgi:Kef-type K+ transport system membrane component KefB
VSTTETFLIAMILIFATPYLLWRLGRTDYYAPLVVVQIIVGIILGPGVLGALYPAFHAAVFTAPVIQALSGIAWWGVMLFVWIAGIELDLGQAWRHRRESSITAALAMGTPLVLGCAVAVVLAHLSGWMGSAARPWQFILGTGMACAVTALPVLILLLEKLGILRLPLGQRILRYASLDDIAIWGVLALILMDWQRVGWQAGFVVAFAVAAYLFRKLMARLAESDRWYVGMVWLALCGFAADRSGLHFMVGAFLSGAVIDTHWFNQRQMDRLRENVLLIVMPVYFLSTGLRTNWTLGGSAVFAVAAVLLVVSVGGKLMGIRIAGRILKWSSRETSIIGWLLQTKGLIMIVFVNILLDKNLITGSTFTALLLMSIASTMLTIPRVKPLMLVVVEPILD